MQRATNEWDEAKLGPWDWSKNKARMTKFMEEGIQRAGKNESYFTVGLRGLGDGAVVASNAIEMLKDVFQVQRGIIKKYHGSESAVNQVWAVYKEVASYYDAGLDPPKDVTILFPDDNAGNVYRLPTGDEAKRKGGNGVYFHLEYVGMPRGYKWGNSNNLPKLLKELMHSYLRGATRIWIFNVGDIKPLELPFSFVMDLAWDVTKFSFEGLPGYLTKFATREFGPEHAEEIGSIWLEHSHLVGLRRHELVTAATYSQLNYHEAERVLGRWHQVAARAKALYAQIDAASKPAFFQLVYHPVVSSALYHAVNIGVGTNYRFALERRNSANKVAHQVLADFESAYDMVEEWDAVLDGKWALTSRVRRRRRAPDVEGSDPRHRDQPLVCAAASEHAILAGESRSSRRGLAQPDGARALGRFCRCVDADHQLCPFVTAHGPLRAFGAPRGCLHARKPPCVC